MFFDTKVLAVEVSLSVIVFCQRRGFTQLFLLIKDTS